jgi:hypothetical protein
VIETIGHVFLYFKNVLETNAMLIKKAGKLKKKRHIKESSNPAGPGLKARRGLRLEIAVP